MANPYLAPLAVTAKGAAHNKSVVDQYSAPVASSSSSLTSSQTTVDTGSSVLLSHEEYSEVMKGKGIECVKYLGGGNFGKGECHTQQFTCTRTRTRNRTPPTSYVLHETNEQHNDVTLRGHQ